MAIIRWLLFLLIGLPTQLLVYLVYPILHLYWKLLIFKKKQVINPLHDYIIEGNPSATRNNGMYLKNKDDHGALTMYGFLTKEGLEALVDSNGNFIRRVNEDNSIDRSYVSGDVVVSWVFASLFTYNKVDTSTIKRVTINYIKYLGTRSYDIFGSGHVSNRCNNFGINYCPDSATFNLGQPMAGPQFYTNSALLAAAYNLGIGYKLLFWLHWIILGGWYWANSPIIYPSNNGLYYVRDIVMKSLYVHLQVFGPKWWIVKPMKYIAYDIAESNNELFLAMLGQEPIKLPLVMDAFFSQKRDSSSVKSTTMSSYIPSVIRYISKNTRYKE